MKNDNALYIMETGQNFMALLEPLIPHRIPPKCLSKPLYPQILILMLPTIMHGFCRQETCSQYYDRVMLCYNNKIIDHCILNYNRRTFVSVKPSQMSDRMTDRCQQSKLPSTIPMNFCLNFSYFKIDFIFRFLMGSTAKPHHSSNHVLHDIK